MKNIQNFSEGRSDSESEGEDLDVYKKFKNLHLKLMVFLKLLLQIEKYTEKFPLIFD